LTAPAARRREGAPSTIEVEGLSKTYGGPRGRESVRALDGVSFAVGEGEIFGFLGPNGAGKTTAIRIMATLLRPTEGRARVAGFDVAAEPAEVRRRIGFAAQTVALDILSTGRENIELIGRCTVCGCQVWPGGRTSCSS
jgi:ABC-2 type transport system ATP-binding protein